MISALKIAGSVYFFFLPAVGKTVHHPHHLLCALPVPGDMSASFNGKFRNDNSNNASTTKPRLASAIENILQWLIKHVLLSQCSSLKVNMNAVSNKAILKGNISKISVSARDCIFRFKLNSVVGAAAAFGDAAQQSMEAERRRMQNGTPLLPGSAAELPNLSSQDQQQQQGLTSALLSATSFELTNAGFMDGKVVFDAKAILPRDENGVSNSLQFRIRAKLAPTAISETVSQTIQQQDAQEVYNALGFLQPECRLATNPLYAPIGGNLLRNLLPNLIPEYLWLPFGVGVAVPLGRGCEIYRAEIDACKEGGFLCKIDGSVNVVNSSSNIQ
eukprot:scaffold9736_cov144-Skeletonema_marinoi.AAC.12